MANGTRQVKAFAEPRTVMLIKSLLKLLEGRTREPWRYGDQAPFDLLLVEVEGFDYSGQIEQLASPETRLVHLARSEPSGVEPARVLRLPLKAAQLMDLLDRLAEIPAMAFSEQALQAAAPADSADGQGATFPEALFGLWARRKSNEVWLLSLKDEPACLIDFGKSQCRTGERFANLGRAMALRPFFAAKLQAGDELLHDVKPAPLDQMWWRLGRLAGNGRPIPYRPAHGIYRLATEPAFESLIHDATDLKIASRLLEADLDAGQIAAELDVDPGHVENFLNACWMCSYLHCVSDPDSVPSEPGKTEFFSQIRKRFGL